jgi:hypothetical protein
LKTLIGYILSSKQSSGCSILSNKGTNFQAQRQVFKSTMYACINQAAYMQGPRVSNVNARYNDTSENSPT